MPRQGQAKLDRHYTRVFESAKVSETLAAGAPCCLRRPISDGRRPVDGCSNDYPDDLRLLGSLPLTQYGRSVVPIAGSHSLRLGLQVAISEMSSSEDGECFDDVNAHLWQVQGRC